MKAFRNIFLYVCFLVLSAVVSVVFLVPEGLLPSRCGLTDVPLQLRLALQLGANPARSGAAKQLFRCAACLDNEEVVRLLLEYGLTPQDAERDVDESTLIAEVADNCGELSMVRFLVENGAPLPPLSGTGAPEWDELSAEMTEYLLLCGLQPGEDKEDGCDLYSLCSALLRHYEGREQELLNLLNAEKIHPQLRISMLERAISRNKTALVRALLQSGVSLAEADVQPGNIVHAGCGEAETDITPLVQVLKEAGFSLNQADGNGVTPLEVAFDAAHREVYRVLVAAGADEAALRQKVGEAVYLAQFGTVEELAVVLASATEEQKEKALSMALTAERADVVRLLLDAGLPLNSLKPYRVAFDTSLLRDRLKVGTGETPEWREDIAHTFGMVEKEVYPILLEAYGDINAPLADETLLARAVWTEETELLRFLLENGAKITPDAVFNCGTLAELELLLEAGIDVNMRDELGETLLHKMQFRDKPECVAAILKHGGDINARDRYGNTALHEAVLHNQTDMVRLLLQAGADRSVCNEDGDTPEDVARLYTRYRVLRVFHEFAE